MVSIARSRTSGAFRYLTFGCHRTWLETCIARGGVLPEYLGPNQAVALRHYLRDGGLFQGRGLELSETGVLLSTLPSGSIVTWEVVWVNWTQRSPLFAWWASLPGGEYSRDQCIALLSGWLRDSTKRSVRDALCALVGTLRDSPVGTTLGQGPVMDAGRTWRIRRTGPLLPVSWWALYSASLICPAGMIIQSDDGGDPSGVATALGVSNRALMGALESLWQPDLFTMSRDSMGTVHVELAPGLTSEGVLRRWITDVQHV